MTKPVTVFVALGSNLDSPKHQVLQALSELDQLPNTQLLAHSSLYLTAPIGPQDQDDYINAVAKLHTTLSPEALLENLLALEQLHARKRVQHWGARTLDLDLLLYGDSIIDLPNLQVPHLRMVQRAFVLVPLLEIAPKCCLPSGEALVDFLADCCDQAISRLEEEVV